MFYSIYIILKAQLIVLVIVLFSYVIERNTDWKLFFDIFKYPKNLKAATGNADLHAAVYFIVCLITLIHHIYSIDYDPAGYSFWKWLVLMVPLTVIFQKLYYKYTAKDPKRADDDWG